ncbi:hypothetical protein INT48_005231 [Thamnidium elegans]|uniref:Uncharacterized protein n=1 Tax=Thamnidium elegans TaxID=101142 RepID=A0A8H7SPM2_9FUNG|nr:hypothetical protein INT48_005231 [Thamnidium elegans]
MTFDVDSVLYYNGTKASTYTDSESSSVINTHVDGKSNVGEGTNVSTNYKITMDPDSSDTIEIEITIKSKYKVRYVN